MCSQHDHAAVRRLPNVTAPAAPDFRVENGSPNRYSCRIQLHDKKLADPPYTASGPARDHPPPSAVGPTPPNEIFVVPAYWRCQRMCPSASRRTTHPAEPDEEDGWIEPTRTHPPCAAGSREPTPPFSATLMSRAQRVVPSGSNLTTAVWLRPGVSPLTPPAHKTPPSAVARTVGEYVDPRRRAFGTTRPEPSLSSSSREP